MPTWRDEAGDLVDCAQGLWGAARASMKGGCRGGQFAAEALGRSPLAPDRMLSRHRGGCREEKQDLFDGTPRYAGSRGWIPEWSADLASMELMDLLFKGQT